MQLTDSHCTRMLIILIMLCGRWTSSQQLQSKDAGKFIGYAAYVALPETAGSLSGCFSAIIAALSKLVEGHEQEAINDLKEAIITLSSISLNDRFTYMINRKAIDSIAKRDEFTRTREAFLNYNSVLYFQLFKDKNAVDVANTLRHMKKALHHVRTAFSEEVYKLPSKSHMLTLFKNLNMWAKRPDISETLSFALDIISVRVSLEFLNAAVDNRKIEDIAASCLGISAGIVGLKAFVKSIATEISLTGNSGMAAGAVLHVAASLINFNLNPSSQSENQTHPVNFETVTEIQSLREHSKKQLRRMNVLISNQELGLNDVYIVNQGVFPKWGILYRNDVGRLHFGTSLNDSSVEYPIYRKEDSTDVFLVAGKPRRVSSAADTGKKEDLEIVGFDFYGVYSKGYPYKGSTIFVNTNNINRSDYRLNGLEINTGINKRWYHPNDQVILTDMGNLDNGETISISMGKGDDLIIISGMFGKFEKTFENILQVDLGTGLNTLSFEGMRANQNDIKGIFFDSKVSALSYFYGEEATLHKIGVVRNVKVLIGSPMNDYIILYGNDNGNPNGVDLTIVQNSGRNFYEINTDELTNIIAKKTFQIIDNSDKIPTVVIRTSSSMKRNDIVFVGNKLKVYKAREKQSTELIASIHIISNKVAIVKTVDLNDGTILDDIPCNHLGTEYVNGLSLHSKGQREVNGTNDDDICLLKCEYSDNDSSSLQTIDLLDGNDIIVLKDSTFIAPCKINDKDHEVFLDPDSNDEDAWHLTVRTTGKASSSSRNHKTFLLKNVERIVNAFGSTVLYLSKEKREKVNLLDAYVTVTSHDMGLSQDVE